MTRDKFLKQLADQEKREGSSEDIELLRKLVNSINSARLLMMLVKVDFVRYGTQCYQCHRNYKVSDELRALINLEN